jgi:hypothetical protein
MPDKKKCNVSRFSTSSETIRLIDFPVDSLLGIVLISLWVFVIFLSINTQGNKDISIGHDAIFCQFSINEILHFCQFNLISWWFPLKEIAKKISQITTTELVGDKKISQLQVLFQMHQTHYMCST